ncbi:MAG: hypothetical protein IIB60_06305 [Planctomycetes bacterium]|nr:hypothetical protein [Planctomycetota bacterium]
MWTILLRVEGDPTALRANIDRLLHSVLKEAAPNCAVQMKQDPDGIWFIHLGIQGPALMVTDRWLIISFSPQAVRLNASLLGSARK